MFVPIRSARQRAGLTLMELVVVLVILAALAALVVPRLGFLQSQSTQVSGAAGSADLINNLETFKLTAASYPQRFDSLLDSSGALSTYLWNNGAGGGTRFRQPSRA
jgi:prepilin-type N-terminal cleavage/methylation domain-containing protein